MPIEVANRLASLRAEAQHLGWVTESSTDEELPLTIDARLRETLKDRGVRDDLIEAVLYVPYQKIISVLKRAEALSSLLNDVHEQSVAAAATRVRRILQATPDSSSTAPDRAALTVGEERILLAFVGTITPQIEQAIKAGDYRDALDTLDALSEPIHRLLDKHPDLPEDESARVARLALLAQADRLYLRLADFSRLEI